MKKCIISAALAFTAAAISLALLAQSSASGGLLSLAITCGTFAYHLLMRLLVGTAVNGVMHNRANYLARWYQPLPFEEKLYRRLRLWRWKGKLPTYEPQLFSMQRPLDEVIQAMCQAEIVHEIIALLSFMPLFAVKYFGAFPVFLISSILAACVDLCFVMASAITAPAS